MPAATTKAYLEEGLMFVLNIRTYPEFNLCKLLKHIEADALKPLFLEQEYEEGIMYRINLVYSGLTPSAVTGPLAQKYKALYGAVQQAKQVRFTKEVQL